MERKRQKLTRQPPKKEKPPETFSGRLVFRIFLSVLLILAAIFIKQNLPEAAAAGREVLSVWTVSLPAF